MQDRVLEVRVVDGEVVRAPGVGPVAMIWLPQDGQVIAKIPAMTGNRRWLRHTVGIRSPHLDDQRWHLPRNCLFKLVTAAIDRYGYIVVWRDMSKLSRCSRKCLEAEGIECDCACMGAYRGENSSSWFERVGDVVVADRSEITRTAASGIGEIRPDQITSSKPPSGRTVLMQTFAAAQHAPAATTRRNAVTGTETASDHPMRTMPSDATTSPPTYAGLGRSRRKTAVSTTVKSAWACRSAGRTST